MAIPSEKKMLTIRPFRGLKKVIIFFCAEIQIVDHYWSEIAGLTELFNWSEGFE